MREQKKINELSPNKQSPELRNNACVWLSKSHLALSDSDVGPAEAGCVPWFPPPPYTVAFPLAAAAQPLFPASADMLALLT